MDTVGISRNQGIFLGVKVYLLTQNYPFMKNLFFTCICIFAIYPTFAQDLTNLTLDELRKLQTEKTEVKKNIDKNLADIDKAIKEFPGWTTGLAGLVGLDFAGANNWFANDVETNSGRGFGVSVNAFANGNMEKYFVRNNIIANINTSKATIDDIKDDGTIKSEEISAKASYFEISNLSGFYVAKNLAVSAKASYITTIFEFNDPGQLSFSAGLTWTPTKEFAAYIHPLGYQWTFPSGDFASATGAEIGASYTGTLLPGIDWTSNFNAFLAYSGGDIDGVERSAGDLSNWTWMNTFSVADIFKGIGLGVGLGLRNNKQLGFNKGQTDGGGLQTLYNIGLSYAL